jgi:hypothetical protein
VRESGTGAHEPCPSETGYRNLILRIGAGRGPGHRSMQEPESRTSYPGHQLYA